MQLNQEYVINHNLSKELCDLSQVGVALSEIGQKIKEARESKGLTLQQLGHLMGGMSHATISKIENGINNPSKRTLIALAKALNDDFGIEWLRDYIDYNNPSLSKREIIEETSVEEIFTLKFGGKNSRRTKEDIIRLRKLLDREIEKMLNESD